MLHIKYFTLLTVFISIIIVMEICKNDKSVIKFTLTNNSVSNSNLSISSYPKLLVVFDKDSVVEITFQIF